MSLSAITLQEVTSSNIKGIGCMQKDNGVVDLVIEFNNGAKYSYSDVPYDTYQGLIDAPSIGKFFNAEIKGTFSEQKLN